MTFEELKKLYPSIPLPFLLNITNSLYVGKVFNNIEFEELRDALSSGQIYSKLWLLHELDKIVVGLNKPEVNVAIVGGWIGTLPLLWFTLDRQYNVKIASFDIDDHVNEIARTVNAYYPFTAITRDMYDVDYTGYDIVINTSCEHISNVEFWRMLLPPSTLLVAQSNDFFGCPQHISCVNNVNELVTQLNPKETLYTGTLNCGIYNRFMVICKT